MARPAGAKNRSIDERIERTKQEIAYITRRIKDYEVRLEEKKNDLKKLEEQKNVENEDKLIDEFRATGKSYSELLILTRAIREKNMELVRSIIEEKTDQQANFNEDKNQKE